MPQDISGQMVGTGRRFAIAATRFNGHIVESLVAGAVDTLVRHGVDADAITVVRCPGAWELPLVVARLAAAKASGKGKPLAGIVALGCVIRGETPHFDYVAGEAASGLQLAALETGVPVAFGVLTLEEASQADGRLEKGAEAVRTGLEMADVFAQLRAAAQR